MLFIMKKEFILYKEKNPPQAATCAMGWWAAFCVLAPCLARVPQSWIHDCDKNSRQTNY
jgi:hypothetical protein